MTPAILACLAGHRWTVATRLWRDGDWWHLSSRSPAGLSGVVTSFSATARRPENASENWVVVPELAGVEDLDEAARIIGAHLERGALR